MKSIRSNRCGSATQRGRLEAFKGLIMGVSLSVCASVPAAAKDRVGEALSAYHDELHLMCSMKHLELLSPADLLGRTEDFLRRMPTAKRRQVRRLVGMDRDDMPAACQDEVAGATCPAVYEVYGIQAVGLLRSFAGQVCAHYKRCTAQSECDYAKPEYGPHITYHFGNRDMTVPAH